MREFRCLVLGRYPPKKKILRLQRLKMLGFKDEDVS
jgi:hypothetical protein